jgi:hexokinase
MAPTSAVPSPNSGTRIPVAILTKLGEIEHDFVITDELLGKILDRFVKDFAVGLSKYGEDMAMVPTYVTGVPTGKETG